MIEYCEDGSLMRESPATWDEPACWYCVGTCPKCGGIGCDELDGVMAQAERAAGIEQGARE